MCDLTKVIYEKIKKSQLDHGTFNSSSVVRLTLFYFVHCGLKNKRSSWWQFTICCSKSWETITISNFEYQSRTISLEAYCDQPYETLRRSRA